MKGLGMEMPDRTTRDYDAIRGNTVLFHDGTAKVFVPYAVSKGESRGTARVKTSSRCVLVIHVIRLH